MGESVNYASANAKTSERAGAGHKDDFGNVLPGFAIFGELIFDEFEQFFGKIVCENMTIFVVIQL